MTVKKYGLRTAIIVKYLQIKSNFRDHSGPILGTGPGPGAGAGPGPNGIGTWTGAGPVELYRTHGLKNSMTDC